MAYNSISGKTEIVSSNEVTSVRFSMDLQNTLGVNEQYSGGGDFVGSRPADPSYGMAQLYVYCNAVKSWRVGDSMVPLLRTVAVHAKYGDVSHTFPRDQFVPAVSSNLDVIEVDIRWDNGKRAAFEGGKVIAVLRFKRVF